MTLALKYPIVLNETFIEATRDTGYRSTSAAIAELVDNSIQAAAKHVRIFVNDGPGGVTVSVLDDGSGMAPATLRLALQFGGSNRFKDRSGLGRFGMGLPNASVSQARHVDVLTWRAPNACFASHLDVDEVAGGFVDEIPIVRRAKLPDWAQEWRGFSGTLVAWSKCDRIDNRRVSTVTRKLHESLGRLFRYFIWRGIKITVNGEAVRGIDPLFLHKSTPLRGATPVGNPLVFEVAVPATADKTSKIVVRFSELPVEEWHDLPVEEKRRHGIVDGAGLSILRAGREVDYGWFFFGAKRRENYDSWWRGELSFEPALDELFAITHSKQGISPTHTLREILTPDLEAIARQLNVRVQRAFGSLRVSPVPRTPPVPGKPDNPGNHTEAIGSARSTPRALNGHNGKGPALAPALATPPYTVEVASLASKEFFTAKRRGKTWTLVINRDHCFYRKIYQRAANRKHWETLLLTFAKVGGGKRLSTSWAVELSAMLEAE
jgi:hypothetical protein